MLKLKPDDLYSSRVPFDFSGIHYFCHPRAHTSSYTWLILPGAETQCREYALVYDADIDAAVEQLVVTPKIQVEGMIELQINPYDSAEVWLKYFEVAPAFKGQGLSSLMIENLIGVLKSDFKGMRLARSRPSAEGELYLKDRLTSALIAAGIEFSFS